MSVYGWLLVGALVALHAAAGLTRRRIATMAAFTTIGDYIEAGKTLGKSWGRCYVETGCPWDDKFRGWAYALFVGRTAAVSRIMAYLGIASAGAQLVFGLSPVIRAVTGFLPLIPQIDPFWVHALGIGWWAPLIALAEAAVTIGLYYGPFNGFAESFEGDPFAAESPSNSGKWAGYLYVPDGYRGSARSLAESRARRQARNVDAALEPAVEDLSKRQVIIRQVFARLSEARGKGLTAAALASLLGVKAAAAAAILSGMEARAYAAPIGEERYVIGEERYVLTPRGSEAVARARSEADTQVVDRPTDEDAPLVCRFRNRAKTGPHGGEVRPRGTRKVPVCDRHWKIYQAVTRGRLPDDDK